MLIKYLTFGISIAFISWIVGMIGNALLKHTSFYKKHLYNLNFINSERINKLIGIDIIKWIVKKTFFKFFNPNLKMKSKTDIANLSYLRNEMTTAEISHLMAFIFAAFFALIKFINQDYLFGLIMTVINILMNLYPSLLQQQNKRRIDKLEQYLIN